MDKQQAATAIAPLGLGGIVDIAEMTGGTSPSYRIDLTEDRAVVLKTYPGAQAAFKAPAREAFAAAQLDAIGVPITRFLLVDETLNRLPFRFAVTNYLPGATAGSLRDHPDIGSLYRQTGALLRRLHGVAMPAYGGFDATGIAAPLPSNTAYMHGLIEHAFTQFAAHGADDALTARLRVVVADGFDAVVPLSKGAVFAHDDLHPNNVLAVEGEDRKLRLSGLIDFGNARAADPISDLAKCLFCSEHEAPGCTSFILEGYGALDHPRPQAALDYYTLLHRIIMWWWLRHIGVIPTPDAPSEIMDRLHEVARG